MLSSSIKSSNLVSSSPSLLTIGVCKDIVGITNSAIFDKGSELIVCVNQTMHKYVYGEKGFISDDEESNNIDDNNPNSLRFVIDDDGAVYIG